MARRILPHAPGAAVTGSILAMGEVVVDETAKTIRVGDGSTPGGVVIPRTVSAGDGLPEQAITSIFRVGPSANAALFRLPIDVDDTACIKRAAATLLPVYLQGGKGSGTNGQWIVDQQDPTGNTSIINRSNFTIFGDGPNSTIMRPKRVGGYALHCSKPAVAGNPTANAGIAGNFFNTVITDIGFVGWVGEEGFQEHTHLLSLSAVTNVLIERCSFVGFRGDGIYIGQGNIGGQELHNERVTIRDCYFDGINNNNRNGVSFIDCDKSLIENCFFARVARRGQPSFAPGSGPFDVFDQTKGPGMPGAIDYEPDANNAKIKDARVIGCTFVGCNGNVGVIGAHIPNSIPAGNCRNFKWEDNTFIASNGTGHEMYFHMVHAVASPITAAETPHNLIVRNNVGYGNNGSVSPIGFFCVKGAKVIDNAFTDYGNACILGYAADSRSMRVWDVQVKGNTFTRCATLTDVRVFQIFDADYLTFESNLFDDCGSGTAFANIWGFNAGTSSYVSILNNTIVSPTGKTATNILIKEATHTYNGATNKYMGNVTGGRRAFFDAAQCDVPQAYTPVIEGGGTAGSGTYTSQLGTYMRKGDWVEGYARVAFSAHTGVGILEIGLPVDPADYSGLEHPCEIIVTSTGAGVPGAGKQIVAQVHGFAATTNGPGAIRVQVYDPATATLAPYNVQNVATTIYVRFAYQAAVPA